jgi:tRNA (cmo5U34)-methyltransferase
MTTGANIGSTEMKKFSFETISNFDNHISGSIYGYDLLHQLIVNISSFFIKEMTVVTDLGCTSGKLAKAIAERNDCFVIGYDKTDANFIIVDERVRLIKCDITQDDFQISQTNLITCVFTLQFLSIADRRKVLQKIYDSLDINGAAIICEKEISKDGSCQEVFTFANYENKRNNFSTDEILNKEKDLRKIMNCLDAETNVALFREAGFEVIEVFFKSLNFKGYLCRK